MVLCSVFGCSHNSTRDKDVSFFRFPAVITNQCPRTKELSETRRVAWISKINRAGLTVKTLKTHHRVCSSHFIQGRPSKLFENMHPDWLPSLNLGYQTNSSKLEKVIKRYERATKRKNMESTQRVREQAISPLTDSLLPNILDNSNKSCSGISVPSSNATAQETTQLNILPAINSTTEPEWRALDTSNQNTSTQDLMNCGVGLHAIPEISQEPPIDLNMETQTELTYSLIEKLEKENSIRNEEIYKLRDLSVQATYTEQSFEKDNEKVRFYTGLSSYPLLMLVFKLVSEQVTDSHRNSLTKFQEFLVFLMKLRLNLKIQDLAYRFGVSAATVSRVINKWLEVTYVRLQDLIIWPDRDILHASMPCAFKAAFGKNVAVILDCFEINIDRPSPLDTRACTWSQYKHHNTVKFLIGITPQGTVSFISDAWGGRTSDKFLTENCGILRNLLPGDLVLADRGFTIEESVGFACAKLIIPAFTKGKSQLSGLEINETRKIANLRIHVERVIGLVRNKYTILQGPVPIDFLTLRKGQTRTPIDKIAHVCCALANLVKSVVPFD